MEKRLFSDLAQRSASRSLIWAVLLLTAALLTGLAGCSDDETTSLPQTPFPQPEAGHWLYSVWGTAADNVWAVGQPGVILHWDGTSWNLQTIGDHVFTDVWGTAANDVYAVGHGGVIYRFNGTSWSNMDSGSEENFYAIGVGPHEDIYACGERGNIRRLSGSTWSRMENAAYRYNNDGDPTDTLSFIEDIQSLATVNRYALAGDDASVVMENPNDLVDDDWLWGSVELSSGSFIRASVTGPDDDHNYLGDQDGRLFQYFVDAFGDAQWNRVRNTNGDLSDPIIRNHAITGMWLDAAGEQIYMTTWSSEIATWSLDGLSTELIYASDGWLSDIWGAGDGQLWAVGKGGKVLYSSDGATFSEVTVPLPDLGTAKSTAMTDKFGRIIP